MGKKRKELSHEEVWDDTGLIDSWDQSYEEYKLYHSIHARGERVEDVLKAAEETEDGVIEEGIAHTDSADTDRRLGDSLQKPSSANEKASFTWDQNLSANTVTSDENSNGQKGVFEAGKPAATDQTFPNPTIAHSSDDQALKSLMMSWYWAGYYTGLFEGQRQAASQAR